MNDISKEKAKLDVWVGSTKLTAEQRVTPPGTTHSEDGWRELHGTQKLYLYRIDHVFHGKGGNVPDFVVIRVKAAPGILEHIANAPHRCGVSAVAVPLQ